MPYNGFKEAILSHPRLGTATVCEIARDVGCSYKHAWIVLGDANLRVLQPNLKVRIMEHPEFGKIPAYKLAAKLGLRPGRVSEVMRSVGMRVYQKRKGGSK